MALYHLPPFTFLIFYFKAHLDEFINENILKDEVELRTAIQKIRHISGTTKTGKALDKALQVFKHNEIYGSRVNQEDVAQVAYEFSIKICKIFRNLSKISDKERKKVGNTFIFFIAACRLNTKLYLTLWKA